MSEAGLELETEDAPVTDRDFEAEAREMGWHPQEE